MASTSTGNTRIRLAMAIYSGPESFIHNVAYVKSKKLAGVMFWEYIYDLKQKSVLLNTLVTELKK
ncbi:hypothetical protein [Spirosoma pollinicola]|uniref:hypothetical protein n=1 Tax=Spirosoma pollinicola TaxID=2057025 RepID=UPI001F0C8A51|nr:hypothetical protein [Spirosoma pollinicola]